MNDILPPHALCVCGCLGMSHTAQTVANEPVHCQAHGYHDFAIDENVEPDPEVVAQRQREFEAGMWRE